MSKRVLIVESSLAVRGIAESLLRQNGFEVVAADTVDVAKGILNDTKVDLLLIASDITDTNGKRFFEFVGSDGSTASIPLLVFHDPASGEELPFPPEAIINKPFTPGDFLSSISSFSGGDTVSASNAQNPFDGADFEDDIIDAALGLDKIDVNGSEVIGNDTGVFRLHNKKATTGSMVGYEFEDKHDETSKTDKKIDQINVPAEQAPQNIDNPAQPPVQAQPNEDKSSEFLGVDSQNIRARSAKDLTESSKIEIETDQFGMTIPEETIEAENDDGTHDYNWFINEMKSEIAEPKTATKQVDSGPINITATSDTLSPSAPPPASASVSAVPPVTGTKSKAEGVDDFISEFKKEMEKISDDIEPSLSVTNIAPASTSTGVNDLQWNETLADVPDEEVKRFSKELTLAIASQVAKSILEKLDDDKIYQLLKESIDNIVHQQLKKSS
ncbi:MAG: hypothetical protein KAR42_02130 [candidate division Zixibacteria bacterium]|nr:hypothetical protein [candidate division Zixibacteria bacterium]